MTTADVLELRSTSTSTSTSGPDPTSGTGERGGRGPDHDAPDAPDASWPGAWLPGLLAREEEVTEDDGVHRYRGPRTLHAPGARYLDVTGSAADPTAVRLTVVWGDEAPPAEERTAFVSAWVAHAAGAGWEPGDADALLGDVVVARYVPTRTRVDGDADRPVVVHGWDEFVPPRGDTSRTSGRRT